MFDEKRLSDTTTNPTSCFQPEIRTGIFQVNLAFGYFLATSFLELGTIWGHNTTSKYF